jgi:hypothetical protein
MSLLRTEEHEGLVCKVYDGGVVKVGTTAADRFTFRLKDGDDLRTRLNEELEERSACEPKHEGRELYCRVVLPNSVTATVKTCSHPDITVIRGGPSLDLSGKVVQGAAPSSSRASAKDGPPRNPFHSSAAVGLWGRPPLPMKASKMLPMEPVEAAALTRALSRSLSLVFIMPDS